MKYRTLAILTAAILVSLLLLGVTVELIRRLVEAIFDFGLAIQHLHAITRLI